MMMKTNLSFIKNSWKFKIKTEKKVKKFEIKLKFKKIFKNFNFKAFNVSFLNHQVSHHTIKAYKKWECVSEIWKIIRFFKIQKIQN